METKSSKIFAHVVYPGVRLLGLVEAFGVLNALAASRGLRNWLVAERAGPLESDTPLKFIPDATFDQAPQPAILMVLGGGPGALPALENPALVDYVRRAAESAELVGGIDSGVLLLARAGLLQGRQATTHWALRKSLEKLGARYLRAPWVEEDRFITAAGVSGAMDMSLHLVGKLKDRGTAQFLQTMAEYNPEPPFGGIDWKQVEARGLADDAGGRARMTGRV